ncbi:MAG: response regulator transcription factor [Betaproteobacteria bacterium]
MLDKTKVMIADDHALFRAGLRNLLEETGEFEVIAEASNGEDALKAVRELEIDVTLLDLSMPKQSGIDVLKRMKSLKPDMAVLILSMFPEEQYAVNMLRAGASGYLTKEAAPEQVVTALRTVRKGRKYISSEVAELLAETPDASTAPLHGALSQREFQIFCKLAAGRSVSEIAAELFLSVKTISTYRTRVLEKMSMHSNADLTYYAIKNGIIQ